jgi:hypothetical protein
MALLVGTLALVLAPALAGAQFAAPAVSAAPAAPAVSADSAAVAAQVAAYDSIWARKDTAAARRLMSPAYQYFTSTGAVERRDEVLAFLARPDYRLDYVRRSEVAVTLDGPVAVVSSRWIGKGNWAEGTIDDDQRCGLVFVRAPDGWRLLSEHCVQIAPGD